MDEPELPDELKSMIKQSVEEDLYNNSEKKRLSEAVKGNQLLLFFDSARKDVQSSDLATIRTKLDEVYKGKDPSEKMQHVRKEIEAVYDKVWENIGVSVELGQRAVTSVQMVMQDPNIDAEFRKKLQSSLLSFKQAESEMVGRLLFGDQAFETRQKQQQLVLSRKKTLENEFLNLSKEEKGKKVHELKQKAFSLRQKLMKMGGVSAAKYLKDLKEEEGKVMLDLSALALMIQESSGVLPEGIGPPNGMMNPHNHKQECKKCSHHRH